MTVRGDDAAWLAPVEKALEPATAGPSVKAVGTIESQPIGHHSGKERQHGRRVDPDPVGHPPRLNPLGGQAPVRAHVTDLEAKLDEKT